MTAAAVRAAPHLRLEPRSRIVAAGVVAVSVLGGVAVYSPKGAVEAVAAAGLLVLAFRRLGVAVAFYALITFPEYLPGVLGVGPTLGKPLGVLLALAWLAKVAARRGLTPLLPRDQPGLFWTVVAFVMLAAASALWAPDAGRLHYQLGRLLLAALFLLVVYTVAVTGTAFRTIVWGYLLGSALTAGYGISVGGYGQQGRLDALLDPNFFAAELIPAIVIAAFLILTTTSGKTRLAAAVILGLDLIAFVLTQSRGGIIGLAVALVAAMAMAGRARPRMLAAVLVVLAVGLTYYVGYAPSHIRDSFSGSVASASSGRSDEWRIALHMFANHPFNGVGLGNFVTLEPSYSTKSFGLNFVSFVVGTPLVAHNAYLEVAAELGVVGIVLFLTILALALARGREGVSTIAERAGPMEFYARGLIAGALGMFTAYFFLSTEYDKQLWFMIGLLAAIPALGRATADTPAETLSRAALDPP